MRALRPVPFRDRARAGASTQRSNSRPLVSAQNTAITIPDMTVLADAALDHREREVPEHSVAAVMAV
jgi:hypothetical protein